MSTNNPLRVARTGAPEPASTSQREIVLELLRAAGNAGINRDCFLMGNGPCAGHRITQVGARIDELEEEGFVFESYKAAETDHFVTYRLLSEPATRAERPKFRVKKRKKESPGPIAQAVAMLPVALAAERHVEALKRTFGPDCIGVNVPLSPQANAIQVLQDLKQPGLFAELPASYRDPENQQ